MKKSILLMFACLLVVMLAITGCFETFSISAATSQLNGVVGDTIDLDATSNMSTASISSVTWSFISRPGGSTATISNSDNLTQASFVPDLQGTYSLQVMAVNSGVTATDTVIISISDALSVDASTSDSTGTVGAALDLNATANISTATAVWSFQTKPTGSTCALSSSTSLTDATFTPDVDGTYTLLVTVTSGTQTATETISIIVDPALAVDASGVSSTANTGDTVSLSATLTADDPTSVTQTWSFATKPTNSQSTISTASSLTSASFVPDVTGDYELTITATEGTRSVSDSVTITVGGGTTYAESRFDAGIQDIIDGNYDDALTELTWAYYADDESPKTMLGYSLASMANMVFDSEVQTMISDNLGIVGFPTTFTDLLDPTWMTDYTGDASASFPFLPVIQGETDLAGDGTIDFSDKMMAFINYFVGHNTGLNETLMLMVDEMAILLETIDGILDGVDATDQLTIPFDPATYGTSWPIQSFDSTTGLTTYYDVTIGKAEFEAIQLQLTGLLVYLHFIQCYDLSLASTDLSDLFDAFNPDDGTYYNADLSTYTWPENPLNTFLQPSSDAATHMASAKSNFQDTIDHIQYTYDEITSSTRSADFTFSANSTYGQAIGYDTALGQLTSTYSIYRDALDDIEDSLQNDTAIDLSAMYSTLTDSTGIEIPFNFNFANFFDSPIGLWDIVEGSNGEPTIYRADATLDSTTGDIVSYSASVVTTAPDPDEVFSADEVCYYMLKLTDLSDLGFVDVDLTSVGEVLASELVGLYSPVGCIFQEGSSATGYEYYLAAEIPNFAVWAAITPQGQSSNGIYSTGSIWSTLVQGLLPSSIAVAE